MVTGKLVRWNDEKGYGFIRAESETQDVFIHISVLAHMSRRPVVGDVIFFDMETDANGKCKATNAKIEGVPRFEPSSESWSLASAEKKPRPRPELPSTPSRLERSNTRVSHRVRRRSGLSTKLIPLFFIVIVVVAYEKVATNTTNHPVINMEAPEESEQTQKQFQCQGKTHCSQMASCAEATFYLTHCPGTEMDGDHDGIPCESQWCN